MGAQQEYGSRVSGAEDEHRAMGHHGFASLSLLLFLLLLHLFFFLFGLCLLQRTGFSISLVANCKQKGLNLQKPAGTYGFWFELVTAQIGGDARDDPAKVP